MQRGDDQPLGRLHRSLEDFTPAQLDIPDLKLACTGQRIEDSRRHMGIEDQERFREAVKFGKIGLWSTPTKKMADDGLFMLNAAVKTGTRSRAR